MLNRVRVGYGFKETLLYGGFYGACPFCRANTNCNARYGALTTVHQKTCGGCGGKFWWKYVSKAGVPSVEIFAPRFIHVEVGLKRW